MVFRDSCCKRKSREQAKILRPRSAVLCVLGYGLAKFRVYLSTIYLMIIIYIVLGRDLINA